MQQTNLKVVVSAPEVDMSVPDTGAAMNATGRDISGGGVDFAAIFVIIIAILMAAVAVAKFLKRKKKSGRGFGIMAKKSSLAFRLFVFLAAMGVLAGAGGAILSKSGSVDAIENSVAFSTDQEVTIEVQLDDEESVRACGEDEVIIGQALPKGYTLSVSASDLALSSDSDVKISSEVAGGDLVDDSWGYSVMSEDDEEVMKAISEQPEVIKEIESATDIDDATGLKFCVDLSSDIEAGTYESTISYSVVPNLVQYSLAYDANGGTFSEEVEAQTSELTFENSYEFTVADVVPSAPQGSDLEFYGWSVTGDSLSDVYEAGDTIEVTDIETTLKAVWGYGRHVITYHKNIDGEVQNFVSKQYCIIAEQGSSSCTVNITRIVPTTSGHTLLGWSGQAYTPDEDTTIDEAREEVDYEPGSQATLDDDIDLYAVWWAVSTNDFQIELRWGDLPGDLDSHLVAIDNASGTRAFHVYYSNKIANIENGTITLNANLDIDDRNGRGPETVTLNALPASAYSNYTFYYYIDNYSGESSKKIKESGANITLIKSDGDVTEYNVTTASGESAKYWNVFAIKNGRIIERNTLTSTPDTDY